MRDGRSVRRLLVVAVAAVLGAGVWSASAAATPAGSPDAVPVTTEVVAAVEPAPVCPAEQIEAAADAAPMDGTTIVSFTLVDPRCTQ